MDTTYFAQKYSVSNTALIRTQNKVKHKTNARYLETGNE